MRSREASRRVAVVLLLSSAFLFSALGAWSLVERSTIPLALNGTVTEIEVRPEKHPGVDDVWIVWIEGEPYHLDVAVASKLGVGDRVAKGRWERYLTVNGTDRRVSLSDDAGAMLFLSPAMVLLCAALAFPRSKRGEQSDRIPPQKQVGRGTLSVRDTGA